MHFELQGSSPLTGVLGLAIVIFGLYYWKGYARLPKPNDRRYLRQRDADSQPPSSSSQHAAPTTQPPHAAPLSTTTPSHQTMKHIASQRITISVLGTLLQESSPTQLFEGATVIPAAATTLKHVAAHGEIFLIANVADDIGEAVVRGAIEHENILGHGRGQIAPHRLLFCETVDGKASHVRQLEPSIHIDGDNATIVQLQRFVPQLIEVSHPSAADDVTKMASSSSSLHPKPSQQYRNVVHVGSLEQWASNAFS